MEKVNSFNQLGNLICYEKEVKIDNNLNNYFKITGIINNVFRPQKGTLKNTTIKVYNTPALPVLLCSSENWTVKARDVGRITATETKYKRKTAGYSWTDY